MNVRTKGIMIAVVAAAVGGLAALGSGRALAQETFAGSFPFQSGKALYQHICQGCHMPDGQGAQGAGFYPRLAHDGALGSWRYAAMTVLHGKNDMPPFGLPLKQAREIRAVHLTDAQVADVVNYIRNHFGNDYRSRVTAQQIASLPRPSFHGSAPR